MLTTNKKSLIFPAKAFLVTVCSLMSLTSCTSVTSVLETKSVETISLLDISQSSGNSAFNEQTKALCEGLAGHIQRGDTFLEIPVSAVAPNRKSPVSVSPKILKEECGKRNISREKGTLTKPSFEQILPAIAASAPNAKPLLIVHINSNEKEDPDPISLWQKVAQKISERGGFLLIVGATNQGAEFNFKLDKAIGSFQNVIFAENPTEIQQQISTVFVKLRK